MTPAYRLWLATRYNQDSSFAYECAEEDLNRLLSIFGEMEPIIDAINVSNGASNEQRAASIGCSASDFLTYDDDQIISGVIDVQS